MESNFENIAEEIREEILRGQKRLNELVNEASKDKETVCFLVPGEREERKVAFKLSKLEDGTSAYEFDYLAW